jgi:uncharacterized protein (TIGR03435 family)
MRILAIVLHNLRCVGLVTETTAPNACSIVPMVKRAFYRFICVAVCPLLPRIASAILLLTFIAVWPDAGVAQSAIGPAASFDVSSVRIAKDCTGFSMSPPGARLFNVSHASMVFLLGMAYKVGVDQLGNKPEWADATCYDVNARAEGEGSLGNDQLRALLQNLLTQRFQLAAHREVKQIHGYALVVANGGPKLQATKGGASSGHIGPDGLMARNFQLNALASILMHTVGAHIVDETGLKGSYDIDLSFAPDAAITQRNSDLPSVFTALQEQLGLKLVAEKVPVSMLVIDHIERIPTEN